MHRFQDIALRQPPLRAVHLNRRILVIANLIVFLAFSASWMRFPRVWAESREHGFLIAGLCVWLMWRDRQRLMEPSSPITGGLLLIALASMVWWVALETGLQVVHLSMAVAVGLLWIGTVRGVAALWAMLPIAATFALAIPVWEILVPLLQGLTVAVSQLFLRIAGVQAEIQENLIILRSGVVEVADTCSGLNFFLVGTSIALCYSHLFLRTPRQKLIAVAIGSGLSIAANWVRVIGLILIADATKMKSPLMRDHEVYGWAIFASSVLLFFVIAHRLEGSAVAQSPRNAERSAERFEPELTLFPALACALIGPVLALTITLLPTRSSARDDEIGVAPGPEWLSDPAPNRRLWSPEFEGAPHTETRSFSADGDKVVLDRIRYDRQRDGAEVVSASNRLVGSAKIVDERDVGPLDANLRVVHQTIARDSLGAFMVWSWYRVAGTDTPLPLKAKLLQIVATITRQSGAEVVIVSARCSPTSCKEASESLFRFVTGRASSSANVDGSKRMPR